MMHKNISNIYYNYKYFIGRDQIIALTCGNCMKFLIVWQQCKEAKECGAQDSIQKEQLCLF